MSLLTGVIGGLVATVVMTVVMKAVGDGGPPPTAKFVAKLAGGEPEEHKMSGMALHLLYGIGAGGFFTLSVPLVGLGFGDIVVALALGLAYGVALMLGGMVFWMKVVIGLKPENKDVAAFAAAHVAYGVVLGGFLWTGVL